MSDMKKEQLALALISEIFAVNQRAKNRFGRALPAGVELSHFVLLNHIANSKGEKSPAQLSAAFNLTKGAVSNTLKRLNWHGYIHISPDWDDARRKHISISHAGRKLVQEAMQAMLPIAADLVKDMGDDTIRQTLPVLRALRLHLES